MKIILLISLFLSFNTMAQCYKSDSVKLCFLKETIRYNKICYKKSTHISNFKEYKINNKIISEIDFKVYKNKKIGGKNWFNYCFYPVNYYEMICRKKICGYYNIPKKNKKLN